MNYILSLREGAFKAVKSGRKTVEGRTVTASRRPYHEMRLGDTITFTNETDGETLLVDILYVNHYSDVRAMLEVEGVTNVLSHGNSIEEGIDLYNALPGYKEGIEKYGIYAIGIQVHYMYGKNRN